VHTYLTIIVRSEIIRHAATTGVDRINIFVVYDIRQDDCFKMAAE